MVRVIQISDTHLGRAKSHFVENWPPLAKWLFDEAPDLIVHSGDISVDGADIDDDFVYCRELMADLPAPMLVVPGNHDVGEPHNPHQPVDDARLARWNKHYESDCWVHDLEDWRILGFDTMIFSTGRLEEEAQFQWLEKQMASAGGRRIAWFCHQPLFIKNWDDEDNGYWSVKPEPRARLHALAQRYGLALVGSGHLHLSHQMNIDGTEFIWCPSAAFTVGPDLQPPLGGEKTLGAVRYEFSGHDFRFERVHLPQLQQMWIDDVVAEVYPPR